MNLLTKISEDLIIWKIYKVSHSTSSYETYVKFNKPQDVKRLFISRSSSYRIIHEEMDGNYVTIAEFPLENTVVLYEA